ncbi:SLAM family member 8-like isoform X6 [Micropterus dolomieu]|uniref:SLAM family member 8-like isoform X5 n=1 Tax=Micropterus dolomieu TaxID=147949 RepID=UPI001E8E0531|nr:SLAM family member 8-like isoform X5 [Micropterus dolomieu]XP_045919865.1 SLAM family member 8-like isoform X6 [Micropterus dolomieu]
MVDGRFRCLSCFCICGALLLFGLPLHDVEASSCVIHSVIHKKVGDTVVLSSCLPSEGVTVARWRYRGSIIAEKDKVVPEIEQFKGRLELNASDFSLTLRSLTLKDSGDFSLNSEVNDKQRDTVTIKLQVHEPITEQPVLTANSTWNSSTNSCTVLLECSAISNSSVTYNWTVRSQIISGSRLQYVIRPQDGDTNFTCTVYNFLSEKSATKTVKCRNDIQEINTHESVSSSSTLVWLIAVPVIGIVLLLSLLCYTKSKDPCCNRLTQSQTVNQTETQQPVYSSLLHGDGSIYQTMRGSEDAGTDGQPSDYINVTSPSDLGEQNLPPLSTLFKIFFKC